MSNIPILDNADALVGEYEEAYLEYLDALELEDRLAAAASRAARRSPAGDGPAGQGRTDPRGVPRMELSAAADDWVPACGGTETPFRARSGRVLLYMWNRSTGQHAYYDAQRDLFLSNEDAAAELGMQ